MRVGMKLAYAGVSLISLSVPAMAQQATDRDVVADTDIIVTARRREENKQDVPLVVNAVTGQALSKLAIRDFKDVTAVVPGLSLVPNANGIGTASSLRGVNHDVNVSGNNGTIQYYLDDAPVGSDIVFQTMFDLGQIEVLRGPQGTLRGRATPSGSITLTTHKPDLDKPGAYVEGTLGSAAVRNVNFGISVPVVKDVFAVRVAGVYDHNKGDRVNSINNNTQPFGESKSLRASALFQPVDWFKAGFSFTTINRQGGGYDQNVSYSLVDPTIAPSAGAPNYGTVTIDARKSTEFQYRTTDVHFHRYDWNAQASFAGQTLYYVGSHDSSRYNPVTPNDKTGYFPSLTTNMQNTVTLGSGTTHEVRLQNAERVLGMFDYVVGYFHTASSSVTALKTGSVLAFRGQIAPGVTFALPTPPSVNIAAIDIPLGGSRESSVFGNITAHFGSHTELAGGLRHITFTDPGQSLYINCADPTFVTCTPSSPALDNSFKKTIYSFTLRHRFSDDVMVYASTGSSVRPGAHAIGDFSRAAYSPNEQTHTHTPPETSKSYEIGFKTDWLDKKLLFNMSYYHQTFKNYPFRAATGIYYLNYADGVTPSVGQFNFISAVPVKVDGVESEISFTPSKHFNLSATIDWSKSKLGAAELACNVTPAGVIPTVAQLQAALPAGEHLGVCQNPGGQAANFQAPWNGTIQGEYSYPLLGHKAEGFVRGLVSWHGATNNDPNNPYDDIGAYAVLNAYAGIRAPDGAWSLTFYGKNLADLRKISTLESTPFNLSQTNVLLAAPTFRTPVGTSSSNNISRYGLLTTIAPRELGVTLRIAFGSR
ncbi:MAG: TonB-dependent receptor [Sphingomonadales bacterium]|nr:TonB-dependent receptor [Sphingomonadales bacterium]